jgi:hypothetical protein
VRADIHAAGRAGRAPESGPRDRWREEHRQARTESAADGSGERSNQWAEVEHPPQGCQYEEDAQFFLGRRADGQS